MTNPNPTYITDAMWQLWLSCESFIPGVRLGGIYAAKSGYHNTVNSNKKTWPTNYSIQLPWDLTQPDNKARAIDLTMDDAQMRQRTRYLQASALDPVDDRLKCVREFYGTLDSVNVYGLTHSSETAGWSFVSSDSSHLWHIHISIPTEYCDDWPALQGLVSVLKGETYQQWLNEGGHDVPNAIQTFDSNTGDTIFLIPSAGGWRRLPKALVDASKWTLQNALDSFRLAGMGVDTTWATSSYDFTDPSTLASWGHELKPCDGLQPEDVATIAQAAETGAESGALGAADEIAAAVAAELGTDLVDYDRIETIVDRQLDQQSMGGADA